MKILVRCQKFEFTPVFIDESKIELSNNHLRTWRFRNEYINFRNCSKVKSNLILAAGANKIYHYKILTENSNAKEFLLFLRELEEKLEKENKKKFYTFSKIVLFTKLKQLYLKIK